MRWLIGLTALASLILAIWFGTANLRTDRAIEFDTASRSALERGDTAAAYRDAQFSYALAPRAERALSLGSLAYLRQDYAAAEQHFRKADRGDQSARTRALVGLAASAAQAGDDRTFDRAVERIGTPSNEGLRLALANAAIDSGDLADAARILKDDRPNSQNVGFTKALGQAKNNIREAQKTLVETKPGTVSPTFVDPAYEAFMKDLVAVPQDGMKTLSGTLERTVEAAADVTKITALAEALYGFSNYRAAERLARDAVQSQPDYRDAWNVLGSAQLSLRNYSETAKSLKISTDLDPGYGYTWYLRSQLAEATGKQSPAEEFQKRAELLGYEKP